MPTLNLITNVPGDRVASSEILRDLSKAVASSIGKPETYVMVSLTTDKPMCYAGTEEPCAYGEVISIGGLGGDKNKKISAALADVVSSKLGVDSGRFYIKFYDVKGSGRIQTLLIAARTGHVVYERFYDTFKDTEKAEIRAAIDEVAEPKESPDDTELVGRYKYGYILVIPSGELLFCALGTGEYNPLALGMVLRSLIDALKDITRTPQLTDVAVFQHYAQTILVIDEVCKEGLVEFLDKTSILKAVNLKLPTYAAETLSASDKGIAALKSLVSQKK